MAAGGEVEDPQADASDRAPPHLRPSCSVDFAVGRRSTLGCPSHVFWMHQKLAATGTTAMRGGWYGAGQTAPTQPQVAHTGRRSTTASPGKSDYSGMWSGRVMPKGTPLHVLRLRRGLSLPWLSLHVRLVSSNQATSSMRKGWAPAGCDGSTAAGAGRWVGTEELHRPCTHTLGWRVWAKRRGIHTKDAMIMDGSGSLLRAQHSSSTWISVTLTCMAWCGLGAVGAWLGNDTVLGWSHGPGCHKTEPLQGGSDAGRETHQRTGEVHQTGGACARCSSRPPGCARVWQTGRRAPLYACS